MAGVTNSSTGTTAVPQAPGARAQANDLGGKTSIDDAVVAKIAGIAARDVKGVYALGGGAARMVGAVRDAFNNTDLAQGISVEVGEKQVAVDVTIVADYPVALQKVADDVRGAIGESMRDLVGLEVAEVNVTVNDVHIPSEDDDQEEDGRTGRVQ